MTSQPRFELDSLSISTISYGIREEELEYFLKNLEKKPKNEKKNREPFRCIKKTLKSIKSRLAFKTE